MPLIKINLLDSKKFTDSFSPSTILEMFLMLPYSDVQLSQASFLLVVIAITRKQEFSFKYANKFSYSFKEQLMAAIYPIKKLTLQNGLLIDLCFISPENPPIRMPFVRPSCIFVLAWCLAPSQTSLNRILWFIDPYPYHSRNWIVYRFECFCGCSQNSKTYWSSFSIRVSGGCKLMRSCHSYSPTQPYLLENSLSTD